MTLSSILGTTLTSSPTSVSFRSTSPPQGVDADGDHDGDKASMSGIGQVMSKISDLESTDPAKAKQVLQRIASKLTDAAGQATGDQATHLQELAARFTKAADTGDLSGIQPPKGGHGHHPHGPPPAQRAPTEAATATDATQATKTDQYKRHGAEADLQQLAQIFQSAFDSVTATTSSAA